MMSFERKLRTEQRNVMLEKIEKWTTWFEPCGPLKEKRELNSVMPFLGKLTTRLLGLNHAVFSEKTEN